MNFSYSGGTAQQRKWADDARADCTYPLDSLGANVTVVWTDSFPGNLDTTHPYMATTADGTSHFTLYVHSWADDPNNSANKGLPDPANDIYDFYKAGFVHELGHVVTYMTFDQDGLDTDPRIAQVCSLFWKAETNSGSGRRAGARADWDDPSLSWQDEIREAVAEVFKCTFYKGRQVFMNRSHWSIDQTPWDDLMKFIAPSVGSEVFYQDFHVDDITGNPNYFVSPPLSPGISGGVLTSAPAVGVIEEAVAFGTIGRMSFKIDSFAVGPVPPDAPPNPDHGAIRGAITITNAPNGAAGLYTNAGEPMKYGIWDGFTFTQEGTSDAVLVVGTSLHNVSSISQGSSVFEAPARDGAFPQILPISLPSTPCWIAVNVTDTTITAELWSTDPHLGGSPLHSISMPADGPATTGLSEMTWDTITLEPLSGGSHEIGDLNSSIVLDDWRWEVPGGGAFSPAYPFGLAQGSIALGPGYRGAIQVGP